MKRFHLIRVRRKIQKFSPRWLPILVTGHARPALTCDQKSRKPDAVPASMAGRYVVWSEDGLRIIGHGKTIAEAREMAGTSSNARRVIQKIPSVRRLLPANGVGHSAVDLKEAVDMAQA